LNRSNTSIREALSLDLQKISEKKIVELALQPPRAFDIPINRWTLKLLTEQAEKQGIAKSISYGTVRNILRKNQISIRRTKTWEDSKDPEK